MDENKSTHSQREEKILKYWADKKIFQKTLDKKAPQGNFTFYDGPPFATGLPHYGHILAGTIKDVIPRWKTMQGYQVERKWGWDCHGLPVENLIEKELGLKSKKEIVEYGLGRFNQAARQSVMRYADQWRKIIPRLGRWVDMDNDYRTMDATYTESVWWIFKKLHDKGLIYQGFKSMNLCSHCETTLSNFEVAQGYKDITDISVYVSFKIETPNKGGINFENTNLLAWTTTPWTLPGNVALAVKANMDYIKVKIDGRNYILAKSRLSVLKDKPYEIIETFKGSNLIGLSYQPLFEYYSNDSQLVNRQNGWKVYEADFVTAEDGTGIVHIAPAFGADDYSLMLKSKLPFVQHVAVDGTFKNEVKDFAGIKVKPIDSDEDKNAHQNADILIIKFLANHGALFEKEKIVHSYPHCWRCQTPLLNYAASSWFVKVTALKNKLVKENNKIKWIPEEVGKYRFGNWLSDARDWAISRSRFWGAPIPVWREEGGEKRNNGKEKIHVIGSVEELKKYSRANNTYYVMRHGQADNNILRVVSSLASNLHHLTETGREQVKKTAECIKNIHFDYIFVSPLVRTMETVAILKEKLGWEANQIIVDNRIHEMGAGEWEGRRSSDFSQTFKYDQRFEIGPKGGENFSDIKKRMGDFIYELEKKYQNKSILIVSHEAPIFMLVAAIEGWTNKQTLQNHSEKDFIDNAEVRKLNFIPIPHNDNYEIDLHRPYIDDIELRTPHGHKLIRVADVFDCWFESGAMPYGKAHYPFEKENFRPRGLFKKSRGFPADFIAEGLDQTRGWFYSMLVLATALFGQSSFKEVIVNGLVLAEDGQKMSKSKQNYPDPLKIVEKYGADSLRFYMISSPVVRAQDLCFSEKGVDEVTKKIVNRLLNVVSFYEMYLGTIDLDIGRSPEQKNVLSGRPPLCWSSSHDHGWRGTLLASPQILDRWIISRLNQTISDVTQNLKAGQLDSASRPFVDFIDDLSTWYLRRSRDRFKGDDLDDKKLALETTRLVLSEISKLLAPFMPFLAEDIYLRLGHKKESVHLEKWPVAGKIDKKLIEEMNQVRLITSFGLEARMNAKINVRQPLSKMIVKQKIDGLDLELIGLIKDEVNVKNIERNSSIENEVEIDTVLTAELKEEGDLRELMRKIQDLRKEKGLKVGDSAVLIAPIEIKDLIEKYRDYLKRTAGLSGIEVIFGENLRLK